jgi:phospholipid/cholesterol/gamma-HCH transport system substrate-binding protein
MAVRLGKVPIFGKDTYTLYARFTSVSGLRIGSPVEVFGIQVGNVTYLGIDSQRQVAVVAMKIAKDVPAYDDATAKIDTMGLIGDRYIKLDPGGTGRQLNTGDYITNTVTPPSIDEMIGQYIFGQAKSPGADK